MSSGRMNEATLRRLQQRMMEEGYKVPEDESATSNNVNQDNDNPALDDTAGAMGQHRTIQTRSNNNHHVPQDELLAEQQHEEYLLEQYRRQLEQFEDAGISSNSIPPEDDPNEIDLDQFAELYGGVGGAGVVQSASAGQGVEDVWQCDCGYEVSMEHNFCGVCGHCKPEDWWCSACENENPHYHRFCFCCGSPNSNLLEYEDESAPVPTSVLHQRQLYAAAAAAAAGGTEAASILTDEEAEIERAVARMSAHMPPLHHQQPWPNHQEDDAFSFADDSDDHQHQQPQPPLAASSKGWTCLTCTYLNENETFLSCEMCGSCRPTSPVPVVGGNTKPQHVQLDAPSHHTHHRQPQQQQQHMASVVQHQHKLPPVRRQGSFSNMSQGSEKKETRFTDILARHVGRYDSLQASSTAAGQQLHQGQPSEADLELAMIYAQQERMLAEYQSGRS